MAGYSVIRDPIYGPIPLDPFARELIDTHAFQRLRRVQQLSLASLVYPSAMHTRFEHSVGVYHLARTIVESLERKGELGAVPPDDVRIIPYAGLLHDLSQHLAAHLLHEFGIPGVEHEEVGARSLESGEISDVLGSLGSPDAAGRIGAIIKQESGNPLAGIVAGNCDADKMDYIARDAYHCGLPIGYDQGHLRDAITLVADPVSGSSRIGIDSSGLTSFEQMLYSKSTLYRNVYFHRSVRAAMAMLRTLVLRAIEERLIEIGELHQWSDSELFTVVGVRVRDAQGSGSPTTAFVIRLLDRLLARDLYKPAASLPLSVMAKPSAERILAAETRLAREFGVERGGVIVDFPAKPTMLATDLPVRFPDNRVRNVRDLGPEDGFALTRASQEAQYVASGSIYVFTAAPLGVGDAEVRRRLERALEQEATPGAA
ncbi:MAG TPA: HD domain-containing protein [Longimicrobiales bacterium]|nr:HD domain-containing protein [Longimicrobiales bacterium]